MKRFLAISVVLLSTSALADEQRSPALHDYAESLSTAVKTLALANAASLCGLRSDRWLKPFDLEFQAFASKQASYLRLSSADRSAGDRTNDKLYRETISSTKCSALANSPLMDKLDAIHKDLTGGYQ